MIEVASHAEESSKLGTTEEQFKAGIQLVEIAMDNHPEVTVKVIGVTTGTPFRQWIRISAPRFTCRAVVENTGQKIIIHAIIPKDSYTYFAAEDLWKQYRSMP